MPGSPVIKRIELTLFEIEVANVATDPAGLGAHYTPGAGGPQPRLAVRVIADSGAEGVYVPPRGRARPIAALCEAMAHQIIGRPALAREGLYRRMRQAAVYIGDAGIGPLDVALWDLAGKLQGVSIAQMLGGFRERLPCYASTVTGDRHPDGLSSPKAYAAFAAYCQELGYPAYKIHGFADGNPKEEISLLEAVADRVGDGMHLMYDAANHLPTLAAAIEVGKACDELGYFWYEDPFADGGRSIHAHRLLKQHVATPLMVGERLARPEDNADMLVAGVTDFARVDPDYDGGLTGCLKVAQAAQALGVDVEVHACGPAMRHLMAAIPNSTYYEINLLHPRLRNAWFLPVYSCDYQDELTSIDANGSVEVPEGPGLGVTYDWAYIEKHQLGRSVVEA